MARSIMKWNKINKQKELVKLTNKSLSNSDLQPAPSWGTSYTRRLVPLCKGRYTLSVKPSYFTVWSQPDGKTE